MIARALLWIWLHSYSTQVIHGVQQGGQVHIAFGQSARQVSSFFSGTAVSKSENEWRFGIQQYGNYPRSSFRFYKNPPGTARAGECRIPAQAPTSRGRLQLFADTVALLAPHREPEQFILFLRDSRDRFHVRVLSVNDIGTQMPPSLGRRIRNSRLTSRAAVWSGPLIYDDIDVLQYSSADTLDDVQQSPRRVRSRQFDSFDEGFLREIMVEQAYRNPQFAQAVKERDNYTCVVCGFNFSATYGNRGRGFAECHHLLPFSVLRGRRISTLDEAITVCSNCHRMLHRGHRLLSPERLRELLT